MKICFHKYKYLWTAKGTTEQLYDRYRCTKCGKIKLIKSNRNDIITKKEYTKNNVFDYKSL